MDILFTVDPEARIKQMFRSAVDSNGTRIFPDVDTPGTPGYDLCQLWIRLTKSMYNDVASNLQDMSIRLADGSALTKWAEFFGMKPVEGQQATGTVKFTSTLNGAAMLRLYGSNSLVRGVSVYAGTSVLRLLEDAVFTDAGTTVSVKVQLISGPEINTGTIRVVGQLADVVSGVITTPVSGGTTTETTDQLRYRLIRALRNPYTYEGFTALILAHPQVSTVDIVEGVYGPGTAEVFVTPTTFGTATLRNELESLVRGPIKVYIVFPSYEGLRIRIRVQDTSISKSVVTDLINNLPVGSPLILNAIEAALQNAGSGDAQAIEIQRGFVDEDGDLEDLYNPQAPTNLTPLDPKSKWFIRPEWITYCT